GPGRPAGARALGAAELVEAAARPVHDQDVVIRAALDLRVRRNRIRPLVALVRVLETDVGLRRRTGDDVVRDADRAPLPEAGAEVGVHRVVDPDRADDPGRARCDRQLVDALVPRVRGGGDGAAPDGRAPRRAAADG